MPESQYCNIEHVARTASLSFDWRTTPMSMFTACFDASGTDDNQPCVVVAGFIANAGDWQQFDIEWKATLAKENIPYFHMKEFNNPNSKMYKGWTETKRREFFARLLEIITRNTYRKFGIVIISEWFSSLPVTTKELTRLENAYALAGTLAASTVRRWLQESNHPPDRLELVFENGDLGKQFLIAGLESKGFSHPIFREKKDRTIKGFLHNAWTPLQAADILAYEWYKHVKTLAGVWPHFEGTLRWPLQELNRIPGELSGAAPKAPRSSCFRN